MSEFSVTSICKKEDRKLNSYLGVKGYTISKSQLTEEECIYIRKTLTIKPSIACKGIVTPNVTYTVFLESSNKFYLPKYFGIKEFGIYKSMKITDGNPINLNFTGEMRETQKIIVEKYMNNVNSGGFGGLIELQTGGGKTVIGLKLISLIGRKTCIVIHKEFLMNQWIERIQQFLPNARLGKIQGQTVDIDNKDIVFVMLQTISMKNFPDTLFSSFGLLVVDEVHHISSEVFSKALFKIVTKYTLGLSATMNRKDGTTYVFKYFLGDLIYKNEHKEQHNVVIRKINFISDDEDYNKVITDWRGLPQYSSMISKVCSFKPRNDFILKIIKDMLEENNEQQIIIMAHNKCVLKYLYDAITISKIGTVGFYVGGMKQTDLKLTEGVQIILATYSMTAEALDIPTLTTAFFLTSKTDIVQPLGRILRRKHKYPIVVDIVDSHILFKNQYQKRQKTYKENKYKIISINSTDYQKDITKWKIINKGDDTNDDIDDEDNDDGNPNKDVQFGSRKCIINLLNTKIK